MRLLPSLCAAVLLCVPGLALGLTDQDDSASLTDPSPPAATAPASRPIAEPARPGGASLPAVGENVEAIKTYARGDYEQAAAMLEKAYRANRTGIQDRLILARAYVHLKKPDQALEILKNVLDTDKENPDANSLSGQILLAAGKNEDALKYLEHAWRLKPDPVTASALGRCNYALGNIPKAKTYLTAALGQDIRDPSNSFLLGRIHLQRGSGALAEKYLLMAQEAGMESVELHLLLGQAYLLEAKPLGPVMVRTLAGSPKEGDVVDNCVVIGRLSDKAAADQYKVSTRFCALYEGYQLLKADKQHADGLCMVASGWFAAGNYELALEHLKLLMAKEPRSKRACELQARLLVATRDFDGLAKALAAGQAAKVFDSRAAADFLCRAAAVLRAEGKRGEAIALLKKAEQEQPTAETVLRQLAALYQATGDDKYALAYYSRIVELFPDATDIDELRNAMKVLQEKAGVKP
ncbi:MAG: tetratricopeptide repeat protein [Phycisphaerae bacterium]